MSSYQNCMNCGSQTFFIYGNHLICSRCRIIITNPELRWFI